MNERWTVGSYLVRRLEQIGVGHVFGVPGDYCLPFFDDLEASTMEVVGTCNELNAGYAADGYARIHGVGAVAVTYDVGGLSLLNAVAGSHAERVPVVAVSGSPRTTEEASRHLLHHMTGDLNVQYEAYRDVTESAVELREASRAPGQIDEAIATCLRERRPAYIELPLDLSTAPCRAPGELSPATELTSDQGALRESVEEVAAMLQAAAESPGTVVMAGVEAHRLGIAAQVLALIEELECPFVTTIGSKTVLPETHPNFAGVYIGALGRQRSKQVVEDAGVILSLGAIMSDMDLGLYTGRIDPARLVVVNSERVRVGYHVYHDVALREFVDAVRERMAGAPPCGAYSAARATAEPYVAEPARKITVDRFYRRMESLIVPGSVVLADTGDSFLAAADMALPADTIFLAQGYYMSIGWSVPATLGAVCAAPEPRTITFVGDGAFQMTAQELSSIVRLGQNPVIFVSNNEGYVIERYIHDGPYNDINVWRYSRLAEVFGGPPGHVVATEGDLEAVADHIRAHPDELVLVEARFARDDASETLKRFGAADG